MVLLILSMWLFLHGRITLDFLHGIEGVDMSMIIAVAG